MGAQPKARDEAPTKRAALAGVIIAAATLTLVGVAAVWERPASVPTYAPDRWTGPAVDIATTTATLDARGWFTVCPTAPLPDGTTAGLLLVDGWSGTIPGIGFSQWKPPTLRADRALNLGVGDGGNGDQYVAPIEGRIVDASDPADAALADTWTAMCGEVDQVVMVAPDTVVEYPAFVM